MARRQPPDVRRDQLLDAAERVLLEKGLAATTVADVADAADLAKGTVYLHFASKADLLAGLRARYQEQFREALVGSGTDAAVGDQVDRFVDGLFAFSLSHRDLHHALFHEAGVSEEDAFAGTRALLAGMVRAGVERGELDLAEPDLAADFVLHGVHGVLVHALHGPVASRWRTAEVARDLARATLGLPAQSLEGSRP